MRGEKRTQRFRQKFSQRIGVRQHADLPGKAAAIGAEILVQPLGLAQDGARMLQQRAAGLRRRHALAAAHEKRDAERVLHVADAGRGGRQRKMRALGAVRDAASFDDMAKQAEIGEVETHGVILPSSFTKSGFHILPIVQRNSSLFFVEYEIAYAARLGNAQRCIASGQRIGRNGSGLRAHAPSASE